MSYRYSGFSGGGGCSDDPEHTGKDAGIPRALGQYSVTLGHFVGFVHIRKCM